MSDMRSSEWRILAHSISMSFRQAVGLFSRNAQHVPARQDQELAICERPCVCRTRPPIEKRYFAKYFAGPQIGENDFLSPDSRK